MVVGVFLFVLLLQFTHISSTPIFDLKKSILDEILPKTGNEVLIAPGNGTVGPTEVVVFMHILGIDKLDQQKMDFTARVLLRQLWKDDKLKYDSKGQFKHIVLNDIDLIWTPDTFFSNEKKGHAYDITHPNVFVRIYPDGTVLCSRKLSITVACAMDLKKFPFDKQQCKIQMGAYGSTTDDVVLLWREYVPVTVSRSLYLPLFSLEKLSTYSKIHNINTGEYSVLTLSFYFSRNLGYYLYNTFLPCSMLVIISWIAFWLNSKQLTSRLLLGLAPLLVGSIIIYDQHKHHAKVSYTTCMDCFTGTCLTFMFASVVETVVVHFLSERKMSTESKSSNVNGTPHKEENTIIRTVKAWIAKIPCQYVDVAARFIMPVLYGIFCIVYFTSISNHGENDFKDVQGSPTRFTLLNNTSTHC